jgi:hypothetical protein
MTIEQIMVDDNFNTRPPQLFEAQRPVVSEEAPLEAQTAAQPESSVHYIGAILTPFLKR